jgi:hypothetical protein
LICNQVPKFVIEFVSRSLALVCLNAEEDPVVVAVARLSKDGDDDYQVWGLSLEKGDVRFRIPLDSPEDAPSTDPTDASRFNGVTRGRKFNVASTPQRLAVCDYHPSEARHSLKVGKWSEDPKETALYRVLGPGTDATAALALSDDRACVISRCNMTELDVFQGGGGALCATSGAPRWVFTSGNTFNIRYPKSAAFDLRSNLFAIVRGSNKLVVMAHARWSPAFHRTLPRSVRTELETLVKIARLRPSQLQTLPDPILFLVFDFVLLCCYRCAISS